MGPTTDMPGHGEGRRNRRVHQVRGESEAHDTPY
jgi:hypothetical protein